MGQKINITLKKIIEITGCSFDGQSESLEVNITSITIDSRNIEGFDLYIAIVGSKHDGNKFIKDALKKGIKFAIVSL